MQWNENCTLKSAMKFSLCSMVRADIQSGLDILWFQTLWHKISRFIWQWYLDRKRTSERQRREFGEIERLRFHQEKIVKLLIGFRQSHKHKPIRIKIHYYNNINSAYRWNYSILAALLPSRLWLWRTQLGGIISGKIECTMKCWYGKEMKEKF